MSLLTDIKRWAGVKLFSDHNNPAQACKRGGVHKWKPVEHGRLNSSFWHHGALGREGSICMKCFRIEYVETDQEFYDALPHWLKIDPKLIVPEGVRRVCQGSRGQIITESHAEAASREGGAS